MLDYLQTACVMAMIHMWLQPYQNQLLSTSDGMILLFIIANYWKLTLVIFNF